MPDALHWLGVTKIDRFISMSDMKYDAIVDSGIKIIERVAIPPELIPKDAQVCIDSSFPLLVVTDTTCTIMSM